MPASKSKGKKKSNGLLRGGNRFNKKRGGLIAVALALVGVIAVVFSHAATAAPVPCSAAGSGHYNCQWYETTPIVNGSDAQVGTMPAGTNWVICELPGKRLTSGSYTNIWWAYTESNQNTWGWANALYGKGGANDGAFANVPACGASYGQPPQDPVTTTTTSAGAATPPPASQPSAPAASAPTPVTCSSIGGGHYNCQWYPLETPVENSNGSVAGYIPQGTNWVVCQQVGAQVSSGSYYNDNWAWTEANNGAYGWVNAVYAKTGSNNGAFGGGVPNCGGAHGGTPGTLAAVGTGNSSTTATTTTTTAAAPSTSSCTNGHWYTLGNGGGTTYYTCSGGKWVAATCPSGTAVPSTSNTGPCTGGSSNGATASNPIPVTQVVAATGPNKTVCPSGYRLASDGDCLPPVTVAAAGPSAQQTACARDGGTWSGGNCSFPTPVPVNAAKNCQISGGTMSGGQCVFPTIPVVASGSIRIRGEGI